MRLCKALGLIPNRLSTTGAGDSAKSDPRSSSDIEVVRARLGGWYDRLWANIQIVVDGRGQQVFRGRGSPDISVMTVDSVME